jgi:hypothetical protein
MDENLENEPFTPPEGVREDYAERLAALGARMAPNGKVITLAYLAEKAVSEGGLTLDLEDLLDWSSRLNVAEDNVGSLVQDLSRMVQDVRLLSLLEPDTATGAYALDALEHVQAHLSSILFGFMYGIQDSAAAQEAVFGPKPEASDG